MGCTHPKHAWLCSERNVDLGGGFGAIWSRLASAELSDAKLSNAKLRNAELSSAKLSNATVSNAKLSESN